MSFHKPASGTNATPASASADTPPSNTAPAASAAPETEEERAAPTAESKPAPESSAGADEKASAGAATAESGEPEPDERRTAVAAAVGAAPPARTATGVDNGRPRKPVLAVAGILGAALIAVPLLLAGGAEDDKRPESARELATDDSDTVLDPGSAGAALDDYVATKPTGTPTEKKPEPSEPVKVAAAPPSAPEPAPATSAPEKKAAPKPKPKPKAEPSPTPQWKSATVRAVSVLEVNQAWTTNRIRMVMQPDGNLVVYNEKGKATWASMTFGDNHRAIFQSDGNLVIHNGEDRPIWASKTWGDEGAEMTLRADGKVVISRHGDVVWST
ncbi:mannose-binding protein [Streptomyces sp. enrichment culture]|uniref:mannose-binding protein n=1 Tax=Streptomyces sp. enrichment culture TaxID=1795815 RepID=UPI003F557855